MSRLIDQEGVLDLDAEGVFQVTMEMLDRARKLFIFKCGTPEPSVFYRQEFVDRLREKARAGLRCIIITGPAVLCRQNPGPPPMGPFLEFMQEAQMDMDLFTNISFHVLPRRPPWVHYIIADGLLLLEAYHLETEDRRKFKAYRDLTIVQAFVAWSKLCQGTDTREVTSAADYERLTQAEYLARFSPPTYVQMQYDPDDPLKYFDAIVRWKLAERRVEEQERESKERESLNVKAREEWEAFQQRRQAITETTDKQYAALAGGEVLMTDDDPTELTNRALKSYPGQAIVIAGLRREIPAGDKQGV